MMTAIILCEVRIIIKHKLIIWCLRGENIYHTHQILTLNPLSKIQFFSKSYHLRGRRAIVFLKVPAIFTSF